MDNSHIQIHKRFQVITIIIWQITQCLASSRVLRTV